MKLGAVNNAVSRSWAQYKHSPREQQGVARDVEEGSRGKGLGRALAVGSKVIAAGRWLLEFILMHRPQLPQQRRNASGSGRRAAGERSRREADEQQQEEGQQQSEGAGAASRSQCGACGKTIYALPDRNRLNSSRRIRSSRFPSLSSQPPPAWR